MADTDDWIYTYEGRNSNYTNYEICSRTNNKYDNMYNNYFTSNKFNQPLANSLDYQTQLVELTFGSKFNCPLENSLNYLTRLEQLNLGFNFNQ